MSIHASSAVALATSAVRRSAGKLVHHPTGHSWAAHRAHGRRGHVVGVAMRKTARMELRVVGAGLGRTGTLSLQTALQQLRGGPCYHMGETFGRPDDIPVWHAAVNGDLPDWLAVPGRLRRHRRLARVRVLA